MRRRPLFRVLEPQPKSSLPLPNPIGRLLMLIPVTLTVATIFFVGLIHIASWLKVPQRIAAVLGGAR